jgi:hypothetical protein
VYERSRRVPEIKDAAKIGRDWQREVYSITSSARASSIGDTSRPSALVVFKIDE